MKELVKEREREIPTKFPPKRQAVRDRGMMGLPTNSYYSPQHLRPVLPCV